jgi:hypothetical protein
MKHNLDYKSPPKYETYAERANTRFQGQAVLTKTEFNNLTKEKCHYCDKDGPNGIDRIDNTIGYTMGNCVPCCKHCNYVKGHLSQVDFETWKNRFVLKQSANVLAALNGLPLDKTARSV